MISSGFDLLGVGPRDGLERVQTGWLLRQVSSHGGILNGKVKWVQSAMSKLAGREKSSEELFFDLEFARSG